MERGWARFAAHQVTLLVIIRNEGKGEEGSAIMDELINRLFKKKQPKQKADDLENSRENHK
jgi:hypothetical protein